METVNKIKIRDEEREIEDATARAMAGGAVPLIHDAGGVRTLRDVASKWIDYGFNRFIKIIIPVQAIDVIPYTTMYIKGYDYSQTTGEWELRLSGTPDRDRGWYVTTAILISKNKIFNKVKFGYVDGKLCVLIEKTSNFSGGYLRIVDVGIGNALIPRDGWNISFPTDESGITNVVETPVQWVVTDDGVWYDMVLNTASGVTGQVQYRKISNKVVMQGTAIANTLNSVNIGFMPVGYRPSAAISIRACAYANESSYDRLLTVQTNGNLTLGTISNRADLSLSLNISYIAE